LSFLSKPRPEKSFEHLLGAEMKHPVLHVLVEKLASLATDRFESGLNL
jgi:hypothetical protein